MMKCLGKAVLILLGLALLVVVLGILGAGMYLNGAIREGVEAYGPMVTGTPVTVERVEVSPFSGEGAVAGFVVGNPEGFGTDGAIKIGEARVAVVPKSIIGDPVRIREIVVDGAEITYEIGGKGSNLGQILKHIEELSGESAEGETRVVIDRFLMKNCTVRVSATFLKGKAQTVPLPTVELEGIGRKSGGETALEASSQILRRVIGDAIKAVTEKGIEVPSGDGVKDRVKDAIRKPVEGIKRLFD